jgi:hypothetical protein
MAPRSRLSSALTTASLAVVAASVAAVARRWLDRDAARDAPGDGGTESGTTPPTDAAVDRVDAVIVEEKLRAYREIMREVVALNREAVTLDPERFRHEADAIAFDQDRESALKEHYLDVNQTYESYLYVIDEAVREAASDYVGYLATYQDDGAHAGALLYRAGEVYEAMRADLGLESLFDEESATPPDVDSGGSIMPDPDADVPEVEDFTETLGSVEDLDFFNAGKRRGAEAAESDETDDADDADDADDTGTGSSGDAGAETDADAGDAGTGSGDDAGSATDERSRS